MSKIVYCSNCGVSIPVIRKAMPKFGRIIDLIEPHECLDIPIQPDLKINPAPMYVQEARGKFVKILNELQPGPGVWPEAATIGDRREPEFVKSSAPKSILAGIAKAENTTPAHDLSGPEFPKSEAADEEDE